MCVCVYVCARMGRGQKQMSVLYTTPSVLLFPWSISLVLGLHPVRRVLGTTGAVHMYGGVHGNRKLVARCVCTFVYTDLCVRVRLCVYVCVYSCVCLGTGVQYHVRVSVRWM